jgi:hypothetical protein
MKKFLKIFAVLLLIALVYLRIEIYPQLDLISGFSAKSVASGHFIDGRSLETIQQGDNDIDKIDWATNKIDEKQRFVTSSVYGLKTRKAIYRDGLGATLINDDFDVSKPYEVPFRAWKNQLINNKPFPYGQNNHKDTIFSNIDYAKLNAAVANAIDKKGEKNKRTRSVIVIYKDKIIAEKYTDGFDKNSKILGWSMT